MSASELDPSTGRISPPPVLAAMYLIIFLSGASALVYQVSWSRQIGLLFGHTIHAATVVLTSFFAGLALGYGLGAKAAASGRPLRLYATAEIATGFWAFAIPVVLSLVDADDNSKWLTWSYSALQTAVRWVFCFFLLLPATIALGATLPLIAQWLSPEHQPARGRTTTAYAINTAGSFVGVILATIWMIANVGVRSSSYWAASTSLVCGIAALCISRSESTQSRAVTKSTPPVASSELSLPSALAAATSGFGILALEVLYTRLFSLVFHNSTYTFGAVLAVVLAALTFGTLLSRYGVARLGTTTTLAWSALVGAALVVISLIVFIRITDLEYFAFGESFVTYMAGAFGLVSIVVMPPVALLGVMLPAVWFDSPPKGEGDSPHVGRTTMINAVAAAIGAAAASFVLLPTFGLWDSFLIVASSIAAVGVATMFAQGCGGNAVIGGISFAALVIGLLVGRGSNWIQQADSDELVRRWESTYGWIDVTRSRDDGSMRVRQNLHYGFGNTGPDASRALRQAYMPLVLHPKPDDVLFVGLGTGLTPAGGLLYPDVRRIDVVELIPEVVDAARLLSNHNHGIVDHPKVAVTVDDARHFLKATERRFDVIVADLFVPWESETGYLYTVEHYQAARQKLKRGGLFCQWLPLYQLGERDFELIADSFAFVFPETSLWWGHLSPNRAIIALIGTEVPMSNDPPTVDARLRRLWAGAPLDDQIGTGEELFSRFAGFWQLGCLKVLNTDEFPRVEFATPINHRNRTLLQRDVLKRYFDEILAKLPVRPGHGIDSLNSERRAVHRLILFPE